MGITYWWGLTLSAEICEESEKRERLNVKA